VTAESIVSVIATESGDEAEKTAGALAEEVAAGEAAAQQEGSAS
jgi:monosaccharide-transporting ATPase